MEKPNEMSQPVPPIPSGVPEAPSTPIPAQTVSVSADQLAQMNMVPGQSAPVLPPTFAEQPPPPTPSPLSDLRDASGKRFDPEIHRVDSDGKPKVNFKGNFYGSGRPSKTGDNGTLSSKQKSPEFKRTFTEQNTQDFPSFAGEPNQAQSHGSKRSG